MAAAVAVSLVLLALASPAGSQPPPEGAPHAGVVRARTGDALGAVFPGTVVAARVHTGPEHRGHTGLPDVAVTRRGDGSIDVVGTVESVRALLDHPGVVRVERLARPSEQAVSEGRALMGVDVAFADGHDGSGTTIAVIDGGFAGYQALLGTELPATVGARSFSVWGFESTDHGTAVAEIVHDMAPGAALHLIAIGNSDDLRRAVDYVIANGIDVVNMSLGFMSAPFDGTSPVSRQARRAVDAGVVWVNSAGNYGDKHWGGRFADPGGDGFHDWVASDELNSFRVRGGESIQIDLSWSDSATDLDLCLYRGEVLQTCSATLQLPGDELAEAISWTNAGADAVYSVAVRKFAGQPTDLQVFFRGIDDLEHVVAGGSIIAPADAPGVIAVGAVNWSTPARIEPFSSRGPTADGRIKPDLVGADTVSTLTFGRWGFAGTSASSPHVAGLAALFVAADPSSSPGRIREAMAAGAQDLGVPGPDTVFGFGLATATGIMQQGEPAGAVLRYAGLDRFGTAAAVSAGEFADAAGVDRVFVAVGSGFADAVAGAAVAGRLGAPLLLVAGDGVPGATAAELSRLGPETIVILGGEAVISPAVASALGAYAPTVVRLAGADRYATAVAISQYGFPGAASQVVVATGTGFADALAAGPAAVALDAPVLLTDPNALPQVVADEIVRLSPTRIVVVGGPAAVSEAVFAQLQAIQPNTVRVSGPNRYATAVALSVEVFGGGASRVFVATGMGFADALAGAVAAGRGGEPVLLVPTSSVPGDVAAEVTRLGASTVVVLGGFSAVTDGVAATLDILIGG